MPGAAGCGFLSAAGPVEEGVIEPASPAGAPADLDLGPGVRPLSLGPGDKSSPRVSPSGDRVAFVLDGYVVEKPLYAQDPGVRTEEGFSATSADWLAGENLAVLGPGSGRGSPAQDAQADSLFVVHPDETPEISEAVEGVRGTGAQPGGGSVVAVVETPGVGPEAALVRLRAGGDVARSFPADLRGRVSGLSLSPDGREVAMAVRIQSGRDDGRVELATYRFSEGEPRRVALLEEGLEVIGAPQATSRGLYFVAGEEGDEEADYALYRVPEGSEEYEPVRGVGEDFVPASIAVSPDGGSLAVLGRRSSRSPTDLYVLDLASDSLDAVTANENMEIKTKPGDLAWSPDGSLVVVVARGALPGPKVYGSPAKDLSSAFYNVYGVPVGTAIRASGGRQR
ncbi:TolB family protein [Rubrobacter marinus]|uniref:TolB family protein n=1 Tax=Rubrobacter marinus TaxID=2653852 RepID=UPI00140CE709|nr:PD40 domain-containing protein [Rubrobacter marinus]